MSKSIPQTDITLHIILTVLLKTSWIG